MDITILIIEPPLEKENENDPLVSEMEEFKKVKEWHEKCKGFVDDDEV